VQLLALRLEAGGLENRVRVLWSPSSGPRDGRTGDDVNDIEIASLDARPNGDVVRIRQVELNRRSFIDIRIFYRGEGGLLCPTQKGVAIQIGELWNLGDALAKAIALVRSVKR
jgi:hypothetical protein